MRRRDRRRQIRSSGKHPSIPKESRLIDHRFVRPCLAALNWLTDRPGLLMALVGIVAFTINAALSYFGRWPQPHYHDEFSYLLAADTFAHGRITNPAHPMWIHFESMHILQQPTYMSMYPPAQALLLAAGQVLTGYPLVGSWLSMGLAAAAIVWMLLAWLPARWALLGGLVTAVHPMMLDWTQSYLGGAQAILGGALLLGAFRRLMSVLQPRNAAILGFGMAVLANSRPYEGLVISAALSLPLAVSALRSRTCTWLMITKDLVVPLGLVLLLTAAAMGYYNFRITGNVLLMPEMLEVEQYQTVPIFLWQKQPPTPTYHHEVMKRFFTEFGVDEYHAQRTLRGFIAVKYQKAFMILSWYFPMGLAIPLLALPWVIRREPWVRFAAIVLTVFIIGLLITSWSATRYTAPAFPLILFVWLACLRHVSQWRWKEMAIGICIVGFIVADCMFAAAMQAKDIASWDARGVELGTVRARLLSEYMHKGGRHLILVRYGPNHNTHAEMVYNAADIDASPVVWARDMGDRDNADLLNYFRDRQIWMIELD